MNNKKAAVFILLGQSNAVGHALPMREQDIIRTPLKNVFGLNRQPNQSFDSTELVWSGYTSYGMNLAEEQDNTYSLANCLATHWQAHIDSGNAYDLPDLYIIQIAIGSQGVTPACMWYPEREPVLVPGVLGTVNISLFPFASHIFSLLDRSFAQRDQAYEVIGLHWRGGENDVYCPAQYLSEQLESIYDRIFGKMNELLDNPPIILHKLVCDERMSGLDPSGKALQNMHYINEVFDRLSVKYPNVSVFDVRVAPQYNPDVRGYGLFISDVVHFTPEVNSWVARDILNKYAGI